MDFIYAQFMNPFTLDFPNTWCRISLAKDKIFWLTGWEVFYVSGSCNSSLFEIHLKKWVVWMRCTSHQN